MREQEKHDFGKVDDERFGQGMFGNVKEQKLEYTGQGNNEGATGARRSGRSRRP